MSIGVKNAGGGSGGMNIENGKEAYYASLENIPKNNFVAVSDYAPTYDKTDSSYYAKFFTSVLDDVTLQVYNYSRKSGSNYYYYMYAELTRQNYTTSNADADTYALSLYSSSSSLSLSFIHKISESVFVIVCGTTHFTIEVDTSNFTITLLEQNVVNNTEFFMDNYPIVYHQIDENRGVYGSYGSYSSYGLSVGILQFAFANNAVTITLLDSSDKINTGSTQVNKHSLAVVGNDIFYLDGGAGYSTLYGTHYRITDDNKIQKIGERTLISSSSNCALYGVWTCKVRDGSLIANGYGVAIKVLLTDEGFSFKTGEPSLSSLSSNNGINSALHFLGDMDVFIKTDNSGKGILYTGEISYEKTDLTLAFNNIERMQSFCSNINGDAYVKKAENCIFAIGYVTGTSSTPGQYGIFIQHFHTKLMRLATETIDGLLLENAYKDDLSDKKYKLTILNKN